MPINPKFLLARASERTHRDLAHLQAVCWLPLKRAERIIARTPLVPLTLRHQLALGLARNAFFSRRRPMAADVFLLLWRLHPGYRSPQLGAEDNVAHLASRHFRFVRLWGALGSFRAAIVHRRLTSLVRRCDLAAVVTSVYAYLELAGQDAPGVEATDRVSRIAPDRSFADNLCDWLMATYGMRHDEALDFPLALGNQLHRERQLQQPDGELNVFAPSDLLLS